LRARNERAITIVILATGVASVVTQLLTIREFLALFAGNEFVIAAIFFNWLITGGVGTMLAYRAAGFFFRPTPRRLAWISLLAAAMQPVHLLAIRLLRDTIFIAGSEIGFYQTVIYALITITPYSLLIGFLLPYSLFVLRREFPDYPGATVYIIDNIGDVTGGALFSFVLLFVTTPLQSLCITGLLLTAAAVVLMENERHRFSFPVATGILAAIIVLTVPVLIEKKTLELTGGELVCYREARSGRIQVEKQAGQYTLFLDGNPVANSYDPEGAETAAHYPLAQVTHPDHVLVISAEAGIMREIAKHHPQTIDYVEIDPELAETMFRFDLIEKVKGLNVIHDDARAFLTRTKQRYDAVIMCLPEPETYQLNRFYTRSFFSLVRRHLTAAGVFSFSLTGFDNYPTESDRQKLSSVYNTAAACFPDVALLPGEDIFFLCGSRQFSTDIPRLLAEKGISTDYIANFFKGNITPDRIDYLNTIIDRDAPINTDIRPRLMRLMFARWFALFGSSPLIFYIIAGLFLVIYWTFVSRGEFVLFSTGFANMASEILTVFAFQIFFGYIYYQIGLIVTVFLGGLLPGAWLGGRLSYPARRTVILLDGSIILLSGLFAATVITVGNATPVLFFLVFGFIFSFACGFQFPAILRLVGDKNRQTSGAFTADLIGAAFGALLTSILLIPYAGLAGTALAIIGLKTTSMILTGAGHDNNTY
jgi:spermidine synthase